jgi:hypothetical protein
MHMNTPFRSVVACVLVALALVVGSTNASRAQSAYGDLGGGISSLVYYAETHSPGYNEYEEARVEAWIGGDPAGAFYHQEQLSAWVEVRWDDSFCGPYSGYSNHWWIQGSYWFLIQSWYQDDFEVTGC